MPQLTSYALHFKGSLHIGTRGVTLEEAGVSIPSDTLFSALLESWMLAGGDIEKFIDPFVNKPTDEAPFLLTSAFPLAGEVCFYPMPMDLTRLFNKDKDVLRSRGKSLKKVKYLSEGLLRLAMDGQNLDEWLFPLNEKDTQDKGAALQGGTLWLLQDEIGKLPEGFRKSRFITPLLNVWRETRVPRVTIERITNTSGIYQAGRVQFAKECGLWFGVDWRKPDESLADETSYKSAFERALLVLQDNGLGGERSSGYGAFTSEVMPTSFTYNEPNQKDAAYLLNRYIPAEGELPEVLTDPRSAYELFALNGWLRSFSGKAQRRKRQTLVAEGSLVCLRNYPAGRVTKLRPDYDAVEGELPHNVYRSGLALAVNWPARGG